MPPLTLIEAERFKFMSITEKRISEKLRKLGMPANLYGFSYTKTAIELIAEDENHLHRITKTLYPTIAKQHNTTPCRVERAIRHAVEMMFLNGDLNELATLGVPKARDGKLTNGEFLGALYEYLKYEE